MKEETAEFINKKKNVTSKIRESRFSHNSIQVLNGSRERPTCENLNAKRH